MRYERRTGDLAVAVGGLVVLICCGAVASDGRVGSTEAAVFAAVNDLPGVLYPPAWPLQQLGNIVVGPLVAAVAGVFRRWRLVGAALSVTVLKLLSERLVKEAVVRERPGATVDDVSTRGDVPLSGQSFVSGHAVLVTALAMVVSPYLRGRWKMIPWVLVAGVLVARVYVGAHNPLDVVGGAALGLAVGGIANLGWGVPVEEPGQSSAVT